MRNPSPVPHLASKPGAAQLALAAAKANTASLLEIPETGQTRFGQPVRMAGKTLGLDLPGGDFGQFVRDPQGFAAMADWVNGDVGLETGPFALMAPADQPSGSQGGA